MSRPYPNRRRKRPGRRPHHRYRGGGPPVGRRGFQDFGGRHIYDLVFPGIRGQDRRRFFNRVSGGLVLAIGLTAAFIGLVSSGLPGAILGGLAAAALMVYSLKRHRFFRLWCDRCVIGGLVPAPARAGLRFFLAFGEARTR